MSETLKIQPTIGCCGIDCGLCPRFHTKGDSVCPGCGGLYFKEKHPSCGFVTCCTIKKGMEVCADCIDYPCPRFNAEKEGFDSFVTHKNVFSNLNFIKGSGMACFIEQQKLRMDILIGFLTGCDDGRSKSFFCVSCALLPLDKLQEIHVFIISINDSFDLKSKNRQLKEKLLSTAEELKIDLKLNNKK